MKSRRLNGIDWSPLAPHVGVWARSLRELGEQCLFDERASVADAEELKGSVSRTIAGFVETNGPER